MGAGLPLKILFVVPYAPTRIRTRPFHLIRALAAEGHDVTVATLWSGEEEYAAVAELGDLGIARRVVAERLPVGRSAWNCLRALPGPEPLQAHYCWSPALARRLARLVADCPSDVIHVEHLRGVRYGLLLAGVLSGSGLRRPILVWDSVDCISSLFRRAAREGRTRRVRIAARVELPRTERYEASVAARFDRVLVTSEADRQDLLRLGGDRPGTLRPERVKTLPNGVDLDYFSPTWARRDATTLVITGKMSYHANATAVVRFVEDVMPAVWTEFPDARVWIVGKDPPREILRLGAASDGMGPTGRSGSAKPARVLVTGTVDDIRPFLQKATLALAPIQYGVGIQNKVLEAMACATPVVATRQAVSALEARSGEDLVVASSARELADAVVMLLKEPGRRARLGQAGRAFVERRHDWRALASRLIDVYREVMSETLLLGDGALSASRSTVLPFTC